MTTATKEKKGSWTDSIIEEITQKVVQDLEKGVSPWEKPWFSIPSRNGQTGNIYNGINFIHLAMMRDEFGFTSNVWVTFKQAEALKGKIKKGAHGFKIAYYDHGTKEKVNEKGEVEADLYFFLKFFTVFNLDQTEGLEAVREKLVKPCAVFTIEEGQALLVATGAQVVHQTIDKAFYSRSSDRITLPTKEAFKSTDDYYGTLFHELIHWTGAKTRLDRDFSEKFGDEAYAFEELVAELGAAFLCAHVGLPYKTQHSAYIASWIKVLKDQPKALFTAAAKAQRAADFIIKQTGKEVAQ